jgi:dephospho-CoA kinase
MTAAKLVVGLVGMPGAGKSLVVEAAQENGYGVVAMGDVIREETRKRGLELNPKNVGVVMLDLRKMSGAGVIAAKCVPRIEAAQVSKLIIDGLRSLDEAEVFKHHFTGFRLIAVHAAPETRFTRLKERGRSDDPHNWTVFRERDMRELSVGLGNAIAMADYMITNEGDKKDLKARVAELLAKVEKQWQS